MFHSARHPPRLAELVARAKEPLSQEEREALLHDLVALHDAYEGDEPSRRQIRVTFLSVLPDAKRVVESEALRRFVARHITPRDFAAMQWTSVDEAMRIAETLSSLWRQDEITAARADRHVIEMLRHALRAFERHDDFGKMVELLHSLELPNEMLDAELTRLRNHALIVEHRRIERRRRLLYGFLAVQVLLVVAVAPFLFIAAEQAHTSYSYMDGLYWALVTAGSIGYGDITPASSGGKMLASVLGVTGVLTVGVLAGLVLDFFRARAL